MKKMSMYARRARKQEARSSFNGAEWLNTIMRCRPYTDEPIPGSMLDTGGATMGAATQSALKVWEAFDSIKRGDVAQGDTEPRDLIDHAIGVGWIRALEIAGTDPESNPMLAIFKAGQEALHRANTRHENTGRWGFDGPALLEVREAIETYQEVLLNSSPKQMVDASLLRVKLLQDKLRKST